MTCGGEFTKLMADHILGDIDGNVAPPIVYGDRMADHLRENGRVARPCFNYPSLTALIEEFYLFQQLGINVRSLF